MAKTGSEWNEMKLHGWQKFVYQILLILTFPFRRWWVTLGVLATVLLVLIIIPSMDGVAKEDIIDWYKNKLHLSQVNEIKNESVKLINDKVGELRKNVNEIMPEIAVVKNKQAKPTVEEKQDVKFVAWNVAEFKKGKYEPKTSRKSDEKINGKSAPQVSEQKLPVFKNKKNSAEQPSNQSRDEEKKVADKIIAKQEDVVKTVADNSSEAGARNRGAINLSDYYTKDETLNLIYIDEPEKYAGEANVSGPNSLFVDNKFVFLYGIYSDYIKYDVNLVQQYLQNMVQDQTTECYVVAYGEQNNAATALCFVNGVNINRELVLESMADNIALRIE